MRGVIPKARVFSSGPRDLAPVTFATGDPSLRLKTAYGRDDADYRGPPCFRWTHNQLRSPVLTSALCDKK